MNVALRTLCIEKTHGEREVFPNVLLCISKRPFDMYIAYTCEIYKQYLSNLSVFNIISGI